jgi:hypothetical protein
MSFYTPASLPPKPEGFTRHLHMHMNFGRGKGVGLYSVLDPEGRLMPFAYQYDTRKGGLTGFTVEGRDDALTWEQLVAYWPQYLQSKQGIC